MSNRLSRFPLLRRLGRAKDPYWDFFINTPPADPDNLVAASLRHLSEGRVFPVTAELHSPDVTAQQIKELATFLGASGCKVVQLRAPPPPSETAATEDALPFAVLCVIRSEYDPGASPGIGGQAPTLTAGFVSFLVSAYIRELGYQGTRAGNEFGAQLAVAAGLGVWDAKGRLRQAPRGSYLYVADIIRTDLPLAPDTEVDSPWLLTS